MNAENLLKVISDKYRELLGDNLTGIYVHGSIAFGCFNPEQSDIDFITVIENPVKSHIKLKLLRILDELHGKAPPKGIEMSVVLEKHCRDFTYPTPYELHFSSGCLNLYWENPLSLCNDELKTDYDLAAHFTVIINTGIVLYGQPINKVFRGVPVKYYLDSIKRDIINALEEAEENPVYIILNLCRVYAYIKNGLILSKKTGFQWGLENLPEQYKGIISEAGKSYSDGVPFSADNNTLLSFGGHMKNLIFNRESDIK